MIQYKHVNLKNKKKILIIYKLNHQFNKTKSNFTNFDISISI